MTKSIQTVIPSGYRLTVVSWENDGDNYQTKVLEGLTKEQTQFYVEFLKWFDSKNHKSKTFDNMYDPSYSEIVEAHSYIKVTLLQYSDIVNNLWEYNVIGDCITADDFSDVINDLHSNVCGRSEEFYFRVVESIKVEYIKEPIVLEDVTKEFLQA